MIWSFSELLINQGVQFIIQIILARLLLPEDFGIIGMITIFIAISNSVVDSGFSNALIREKKVSQVEYSTIFYFNIITSVTLYLILFIISPSISNFFNEPKLVLILRVLSLAIIINSFGLIQKTMLIKNIDFKTQTKVSVIASILSGIIGVIAALIGLGVWSLVIRTLFMSILQSSLLYLHNKWLPLNTFDIYAFKKFFKFGWKILISGLINTFYDNLYYLIIGKGFSPSELGFYTNATKLRDTASMSVTTAIQKVSYPVLSNISNDELNLKKGYKKIVKNAAFIIFPIMVGLASIADNLIPVLLGENWNESIGYFKILCIAGTLYPIHAINLNILQVRGRADLFLKLEVIKKIISLIMIGIVLSLRLGIEGLLWIAAINSIIAYFINTYYSKDLINYPIKEQVVDIAPSFLISLIMGYVSYSVGIFIVYNNIIAIFFQVGAGALTYILLSIIVKSDELNEVNKLILKLIKK